jgi:hypothetical protein
MKIKVLTTFSLLFLVIFLVSCTPKETPKAENFSFVFEESSCGYLPWLNILDTSTGLLLHTPLDETKTMEIPFVLSEHEMELIYQEIVSLNFFDYPSEVRVREKIPPSTFRLKVINGEVTHEVKWTSDTQNREPNFPRSDNLFDPYIFIQRIIQSHSEYPEPKSACA